METPILIRHVPSAPLVAPTQEPTIGGGRQIACTVDKDGKELPAWKQKVVQRRLDAKYDKLLAAKASVTAKQARWIGVPAWKRAMLEKTTPDSLGEDQEAPVLAPKPSNWPTVLTSPGTNAVSAVHSSNKPVTADPRGRSTPCQTQDVSGGLDPAATAHGSKNCPPTWKRKFMQQPDRRRTQMYVLQLIYILLANTSCAPRTHLCECVCVCVYCTRTVVCFDVVSRGVVWLHTCVLFE